MRSFAPAAALFVALALAGCVAVSEPPPIPPVLAERIPRPPPSRVTLIWQPGHWDRAGNDYRWAEGEWVPRAGHGPLWQDGFWRRSPRGPEWVPAHWL